MKNIAAVFLILQTVLSIYISNDKFSCFFDVKLPFDNFALFFEHDCSFGL